MHRIHPLDGSENVNATAAADIGNTFPEQEPVSSPIGAGSSLNPTKYQSLTTASANDRADCHSGAACSRSPNDGDDADQVGEAPAIRGSSFFWHGEETPGVFGRDGLLTTPHVKVLLVLACTVQVSGVEDKLRCFVLVAYGDICLCRSLLAMG